jgi:hypothetical protein
LLVACTLALAPLTVGANAGPVGDSSWHWVRVEPLPVAIPAEWDVLQGTANVEFAGETFKAELKYDDAKVYRHFQIEGTISAGNEITATEVRLHTEANLRTYHGVFQKIRNEPRWGFDRIILFDQSSGAYLGLMRSVRTEEP